MTTKKTIFKQKYAKYFANDTFNSGNYFCDVSQKIHSSDFIKLSKKLVIK